MRHFVPLACPSGAVLRPAHLRWQCAIGAAATGWVLRTVLTLAVSMMICRAVVRPGAAAGATTYGTGPSAQVLLPRLRSQTERDLNRYQSSISTLMY
jgi:hypothetical protein